MTKKELELKVKTLETEMLYIKLKLALLENPPVQPQSAIGGGIPWIFPQPTINPQPVVQPMPWSPWNTKPIIYGTTTDDKILCGDIPNITITNYDNTDTTAYYRITDLPELTEVHTGYTTSTD